MNKEVVSYSLAFYLHMSLLRDEAGRGEGQAKAYSLTCFIEIWIWPTRGNKPLKKQTKRIPPRAFHSDSYSGKNRDRRLFSLECLVCSYSTTFITDGTTLRRALRLEIAYSEKGSPEAVSTTGYATGSTVGASGFQSRYLYGSAIESIPFGKLPSPLPWPLSVLLPFLLSMTFQLKVASIPNDTLPLVHLVHSPVLGPHSVKCDPVIDFSMLPLIGKWLAQQTDRDLIYWWIDD